MMLLSGWIYVALGGALGATGRYAVGLWLSGGSGFPWATFSVNVTGSLLMGLVVGGLHRFGEPNEALRLFLTIGMLGGFTTFSAFSMELFTLLERREAGVAFAYASGSLLVGVGLFFAGYMTVRQVGA